MFLRSLIIALSRRNTGMTYCALNIFPRNPDSKDGTHCADLHVHEPTGKDVRLAEPDELPK